VGRATSDGIGQFALDIVRLLIFLQSLNALASPSVEVTIEFNSRHSMSPHACVKLNRQSSQHIRADSLHCERKRISRMAGHHSARCRKTELAAYSLNSAASIQRI
jgi:hypothetical protein